MTVQSRRHREIEEMKELILDAAGQLFIEHGYEQTTMRKVAKAIEYNPATIYHYYNNKEDLFYALQARAFTLFYEAFDDLRHWDIGGFQQLKILGRRYINFALKNRQIYELMFIMRSPMNAADRLDPEWKIGERNYELLKEVIAHCIDEGSVRFTDVESGAFMLWSMVHGLVSLIIMERCHMIDDTRIDDILKSAYMTFETLLESNP